MLMEAQKQSSLVTPWMKDRLNGLWPEVPSTEWENYELASELWSDA